MSNKNIVYDAVLNIITNPKEKIAKVLRFMKRFKKQQYDNISYVDEKNRTMREKISPATRCFLISIASMHYKYIYCCRL